MVEDIDQARTIGNILQHLVLLYEAIQRLQAKNIKLENQVNALNVTLYNLKDDVDGLSAHTKMPMQ